MIFGGGGGGAPSRFVLIFFDLSSPSSCLYGNADVATLVIVPSFVCMLPYYLHAQCGPSYMSYRQQPVNQ